MMDDKQRMEWCNREITKHLDSIKKLFDIPTKITLVIRTPDLDVAGDFFATEEDGLPGLVEAFKAAKRLHQRYMAGIPSTVDMPVNVPTLVFPRTPNPLKKRSRKG